MGFLARFGYCGFHEWLQGFSLRRNRTGGWVHHYGNDSFIGNKYMNPDRSQYKPYTEEYENGVKKTFQKLVFKRSGGLGGTKPLQWDNIRLTYF